MVPEAGSARCLTCEPPHLRLLPDLEQPAQLEGWGRAGRESPVQRLGLSPQGRAHRALGRPFPGNRHKWADGPEPGSLVPGTLLWCVRSGWGYPIHSSPLPRTGMFWRDLVEPEGLFSVRDTWSVYRGREHLRPQPPARSPHLEPWAWRLHSKGTRRSSFAKGPPAPRAHNSPLLPGPRQNPCGTRATSQPQTHNGCPCPETPRHPIRPSYRLP